MAQLTIYLDPETEKRVKKAAKASKESVSRWARRCLSQAAKPDAWPEGHFEILGSLAESPLQETNRHQARKVDF
jgi:hypothetical protein